MSSDIKGNLAWIEESISLLEARLATAPEGQLQTSIEHGYARYYRVLPGSSKRHYLGPDCEDEVRKLAQKHYDMKALALLQRQKKSIERFLACGDPEALDRLYLDLPAAKQRYVQPLIPPCEEFARLWESEPFPQKPIDETRAFSTDRGDLVRSKSEVIIANALYSAGVPYRYECRLVLANGSEMHPDFTALNKRTRKIYIWEHLGMMDDAQYFAQAMRKLSTYESNGYLDGKNMIITMEGNASPLNTLSIGARIRAFLV